MKLYPRHITESSIFHLFLFKLTQAAALHQCERCLVYVRCSYTRRNERTILVLCEGCAKSYATTYATVLNQRGLIAEGATK